MPRKAIELRNRNVRLAELDMDRRFEGKTKHYEKHLGQLQDLMLRIQLAYYHQKRRGLLLFEGWDAAGKGGAIRRVTERLDPRNLWVYRIGAPSAAEQGTHYLYRFWQKLPEPGALALFDRSWYGRVLVERVEGFASEAAWRRAYDEINELERLLCDDGVRIVKIFLHITKEEQKERFADRLKDPTKRWKLAPDDFRNRDKWGAYEEAVEDMVARTDTVAAPWHLVEGNSKRYARTRVLEIVTEALSEGVDTALPELDPELLKVASAELDVTLE